jgi:Nitronate monooxygenase/Putative MetA-pathway of phenol degradation
MTIWPDHRLLDLLGIELPIILAPMAGSGTAALAIAVAEAGGLGSLACALLSPDQARVEFAVIRQGTSRPINMNFFCHAIPTIDAAREDAWRQRLRPYFVELGLDPEIPVPLVFVGAVAYLYDEIGCDSGSGDSVGCFRSRVIGVGPQAGYLFPVGDMQGYLNLKAYREFDRNARPDG